MVRIIIPMLLAVSACSNETEVYADRKLPDTSPTITMPSRIGRTDFSGWITDESGRTNEIKFTYFPVDSASCYWSRLITICRGDGSQLSSEAETLEGLRVRVAEMPNHTGFVYVIVDSKGNVEDYSEVRSGKILAFGVRRSSDGHEFSRFEPVQK